MKKIIDQNKRVGVVVREVKDGVFAKPWDAPDFIDSTPLTGVEGRASTKTKWHTQPDGSLRGIWYDSRLNDFVNAEIE